MKKTFIPVIKTKKSAELPITKQCFKEGIFNTSMIPLFEFLAPSSDKISLSFIEAIGNNKCMVQVVQEKTKFHEKYSLSDELKQLSTVTKTLPLAMPVLNITESHLIYKDILYEEILKYKNEKRNIVLRFHNLSVINSFSDVVSLLNTSDWVLIDIGFDRINPLFKTVFSKLTIKFLNLSNTGIICEELDPLIFNNSYSTNGFNQSIVEMSVIKEFLYNNDFLAVGNYCGVRNRVSVDAKQTKAYGILLLPDFEKFDYYSVRSKTCAPGGNHNEVKELIKQNMPSLLNYFTSAPTSREMLTTLLASNKIGNFSTYIKITLMNYLERINHLLNAKNK